MCVFDACSRVALILHVGMENFDPTRDGRGANADAKVRRQACHTYSVKCQVRITPIYSYAIVIDIMLCADVSRVVPGGCFHAP